MSEPGSDESTEDSTFRCHLASKVNAKCAGIGLIIWGLIVIAIFLRVSG